MTIDTSAQKAFPGIDFEFGNPPEKHSLVYDLYAFCKLDEATGKNPLNGDLWTNIRPNDVAVLIWAGLLHEENLEATPPVKALTLDQVKKKVQLHQIGKLSAAIQGAFAQASAGTDEEKKTSPESPVETPVAVDLTA